MIISFEDTLNKKDWLHSCLLNSLTGEAVESGKEKMEYNVKLLVNGIELEPTHLNELLLNIEKYIDREAKELAEAKLQAILNKAAKLNEMIDDVCAKVRDEFDVVIPE